ncbi:high affinity cGMP-specific 3',5'-cyclic phosphodiesterase 9A [Salmo salar]|uniref:Phosphodiesterase n=1 Tax=Salmo salar TaxID=8030 RepID=A0A1S3PPD6_SALSA|nr:high affinity cGMP-specific 3',5'-cyclic phosphodiesterase 9A-like [Salmo salar]|eukprot:XP_014029139.1 PREDICTED: high affinity cGMP-specific 3',5'-cyclic phosphodiesterase 9A-like isoform X1 [Salmo salar]
MWSHSKFRTVRAVALKTDMATKIIYFTVNGRPEQAEFPVDCPAQDVKDLFRSAAEAGPHDILKLYNPKGNIINISPRLEPNSPNSCYKLEVVAADCNSEPLGVELAVALGFDLSSMEKRLQGLEKKILIEAGETPAVVYEMKRQVESFREKLESVEHLSWLGLFKELSEGTQKPSPFYHKRTLRKTREECEHVREKFLQMSSLEVSEEVRQYLKTPTFDNWQWEDAEIMVLLQVMYTDLDFIATFNIEPEVLHQFLYEVYKRYNNIPFHNFKHCFCVTQMMYGLIWLTDLKSKIDSIDLLTMLTSAACHDLDHTGYNNAYQINARTELALRYNDISPLENHHCAVAFEILEKNENNIFRNLTTEQYKRIREGIIKCILATDMTRHNEILNKFKSILPVFDFSNKDHRDVLMMIMIKVSDISNEARPMDVAEPWLDCLLQEFYNQSDMEKLEGLPVTPFMDRDKVTKPSSQTGFIGFVLLPLFIELANLFPCLEQHIIDPVRKALDYYTEMEKALEREKLIRAQSDKAAAAKNKDTTPQNLQNPQKTADSLSEAGNALKPPTL